MEVLLVHLLGHRLRVGVGHLLGEEQLDAVRLHGQDIGEECRLAGHEAGVVDDLESFRPRRSFEGALGQSGGRGGVGPQDPHVLDLRRELLLQDLEDRRRGVTVRVGEWAVGGGQVRQPRIQRIGHDGHLGGGDQRRLGRVVQ